jgi:FkbM family methyltransferase
MKKLISKTIARVCNLLTRFNRYIQQNPSLLLHKDMPRSLYKTPTGDLFWLNQTGYLDTSLISEGVFEKTSTELLPSLVHNNDVVLDIGANIGYYTVILSKLIGDTGIVYAFEPTLHFRNVLKKNLNENNIKNVVVLPYGLSNQSQQLEIDIGPSSATIHSPLGYDQVICKELIKLITLEEFVKNNNITKIDFIKIDVDGHEPLFFEAAWSVLDRFSPIILAEISHLHYLEAGTTAWDFYRKVRDHGYFIYNENTLKIMDTETKFLRQCANFDKTTNIIMSKKLLTFDNKD